mgnify:CR=1 FL=1
MNAKDAAKTAVQAIQSLADDEWTRLQQSLTLEHIFSPEELAEMTPLERRLLESYLRAKRLSDWLSLPTRHHRIRGRRQKIIEVMRSEQMIKWTQKIDQFLRVCVYESLRRYLYSVMLRVGSELEGRARTLRRVEIEALKLLHSIVADYDAALEAWAERFAEATWGDVETENTELSERSDWKEE